MVEMTVGTALVRKRNPTRFLTGAAWFFDCSPEDPNLSSLFSLRWRILGINFCIQPSFWLMNALFAFVIYNYVGGGLRGVSLFAYILIWVLCILVCVLVHELGHVITGRIFGQPGNITLTGLGGQAVG